MYGIYKINKKRKYHFTYLIVKESRNIKNKGLKLVMYKSDM